MRCVALSDTHGHHRKVEVPGDGDLLIHAGDFLGGDTESDVEDFLGWMSAWPFTHKLLIAGNHDKLFEQEPGRIESWLAGTGITYLQESGCELGGIRIWGSPFTPRFFDWSFQAERGEGMRQHWDRIPVDTDLLITHGPPAGILDLVRRQDESEQAGCNVLRETVDRIRPRVHVFGHIHEGAGQRLHGGTHFINASVLNGYDGPLHEPIIFDLH